MSSSSSASIPVDVNNNVGLEMTENSEGQAPILDENKDIFESDDQEEATTITAGQKGHHDFSAWHREDLLYAVAKSRRYIHNVNSYDEDSLRSIVETLYEGLPMPARSPSFRSLDEFIIFDRALRKLQKEIRLHIAYGWVPRNEREDVEREPTPPSIKNFMSFLRSLWRTGPKRFDDWNRFQLVRAMIGENIEMRMESSITTDMLKSMAREIFYGRKKPRQSAPYDAMELRKMHLASRKIQRSFRRYAQVHTMRRMIESSLRDRIFSPDGIDPEEEDKLMQEVERAETGGVASSFVSEFGSEEMNSQDEEEDHEEELVLQIKKTLKETKSLWIPPSVEKAMRFADWNHPRRKDDDKNLVKYDTYSTKTGRFCMFTGCGEICDMWGEGKYSDFAQFGAAITTYFKFLKWLYWMAFVLALVTGPCLLINTFGPKMEQDATPLLADISRTTVGNMVSSLNNVTESGVFFPVCYGDGNIFDVDCQLGKAELGFVYTWLDILGILVLLVGLLWLVKYEEIELKDLDQHRLFASSYSVKVTNLPEDTTKQELENHFNRLLHTKKVMDIAIAYDDSDQITAYQERSTVIKNRDRKLHELRFFSKLYTESEEEEKIKRYRQNIISVKKSITVLNNKIHDLDGTIGVLMQLRKKNSPSIFHRITEEEIEGGKFNGRAVCAFVTFADEKSQQFILDVYRSGHTSPFWLWFCMDKYKRLRTHYLWVTEAPEPSNILWENLQFNLSNRLGRKALSALGTVCMLFCIVIASSISRIYQNRTLEVGGKAHCPSQYSQMSETEQYSYVQSSTEYLHCYCNIPSHQNHTQCGPYLTDLSISTGVTVAVAFFVYFMNHIIELVVPICVDFERCHSTCQRDRNIFIRMVFMKFLNMGCVFLISEDFDVGYLLGQESFSGGVLKSDWYSTAGTILILSQIFELVGYNLSHLCQYWYFKYNRKQAELNPWLALSQKELNSFHLGSELKLASRYGSVLSTFFVCYMYSTGLPVLLPLAFLNCFITYWVDKYLFVSYYRSPRDVTSDIPKLAISAIKLGIFVHIIIALVTLCNRDVFETAVVGRPDEVTNGSDESLLALTVQEHTIPLLILFSGCCIYVVCQHFVLEFLVQIVEAMIGSEKSEEEDLGYLQNKALQEIRSKKAMSGESHAIDYNQAIRNGRFKRLASYNILHNPRYQAVFSIDYAFGNTYKHLGSVWYHQPDAHDRLELGTWGGDDDSAVIDVLEEEKGTDLVVQPTKPEEDMIRHLHPSKREEKMRERAFTTMQKLIFAEIHEDLKRKGKAHIIGATAESENSDESEDDDDYEMF